MKILVISHEYPPIGGGGANACYFLSREYVRQGHEVTIVTAKYKDLPEEEIQNGVHIIRVKAKRTKEDKSTFAEMFSYLKSAYFYADKLCKKEKFDICQVYFGIPGGPIGVHLWRKYKLPYIVRFGGGDIPGAQKRFGFMYKILSPFIRDIWKNAKALVANSEILRERALAYESRYPVSIIANGVDSEFFTPGKEEKEKEKTEKTEKTANLQILFVSRLIKGKGLQYIIPQMPRVNKETGAVLTIVGDGPYREELEKITDESNARDAVIFVGKKNKEELYPYYDSADMFILPSESEGMPNVVLEAMSMGLPVVMTPCGGSKELIDGNGIISKQEDFVENMLMLLKNRERMHTYGYESARRARELFAWEQKAKEYLELMEKVL